MTVEKTSESVILSKLKFDCWLLPRIQFHEEITQFKRESPCEAEG